MKNVILSLIVSLVALNVMAKIVPDDADAKVETRCGWIVNPVPGELSLIESETTSYEIGTQGGYQAQGDIKNFPSDQEFVAFNGPNYGYYCGCITGKYDLNKSRILSIVGSQAKLLKACLEDPKVPSMK